MLPSASGELCATKSNLARRCVSSMRHWRAWLDGAVGRLSHW